jgi:hypothetical protein
VTECTRQLDLFSIGRRTVSVTFDGARTTSDAGVLLLRKIDRRLGLVDRLSAAVNDGRDSARVDHTDRDLLRQRIFQIALGYEDANDADTLRHDPALQAALGRGVGDDATLASQPTLSRFERRDVRECFQLSEALFSLWIDRLRARGPKAWKNIVLDIDSTDFATYGQQQLAMFHGHYGHYMYHPLLVFDGEGWPIAAVLRPGKTRTQGALSILRRIIDRLQAALPKAKITLRADGGFCSPAIYDLCESRGVGYVIGLITHQTLRQQIEPVMQRARRLASKNGSAKLLTDFYLRWGRRTKHPRRIIAKAEVTSIGDNPRFMITNLSWDVDRGYAFYTQRGPSENRIKDLKNALQSGRMSCHAFASNQFRLLLHTAAYVLMFSLREALVDTELARAQFDTLRLKLLKLGATIRTSARRIWVQISSAAPARPLFVRAAQVLSSA